jgi:hypothetical protein
MLRFQQIVLNGCVNVICYSRLILCRRCLWFVRFAIMYRSVVLKDRESTFASAKCHLRYTQDNLSKFQHLGLGEENHAVDGFSNVLSEEVALAQANPNRTPGILGIFQVAKVRFQSYSSERPSTHLYLLPTTLIVVNFGYCWSSSNRNHLLHCRKHFQDASKLFAPMMISLLPRQAVCVVKLCVQEVLRLFFQSRSAQSSSINSGVQLLRSDPLISAR